MNLGRAASAKVGENAVKGVEAGAGGGGGGGGAEADRLSSGSHNERKTLAGS